MNRDIVSKLRCPACRGGVLQDRSFKSDDAAILVEGVLWCSTCGHWYPVEDGCLELLAGDLAYEKDRQRFWGVHERELLNLGLSRENNKAVSGSVHMQRTQQSHFDWYASNQEQTYSKYEASPFWRATDRLAFDAWRQEIRSGSWLLDVGCAQGRSTSQMSDLNIRIIGFDVSKDLVREGARRYQAAGCSEKIDLLVADATWFPFREACFDYVLIYGVLHHLPELPAACSEIVRVLKAGGMYFGSENNESLMRWAFDWLQKLWPLWQEEAGSEPLISKQRLSALFESTPLRIETKTSVFLPPHLVNLFHKEKAYRLLRLFDSICQRLPVIRQNGGLLVIRGEKGEALPAPPSRTPASQMHEGV